LKYNCGLSSLNSKPVPGQQVASSWDKVVLLAEIHGNKSLLVVGSLSSRVVVELDKLDESVHYITSKLENFKTGYEVSRIARVSLALSTSRTTSVWPIETVCRQRINIVVCQ
jgi:hypothetical protein